jgi:hypothetical protein
MKGTGTGIRNVTEEAGPYGGPGHQEMQVLQRSCRLPSWPNASVGDDRIPLRPAAGMTILF